jgi:predicted RNA-binding Zn ribbon-like protein
MVETETGKYVRALDLQEGWLCLDFANTAEWHASNEPAEELHSYADLVAWAQSKGVLTARETAHLLRTAEVRPEDAAAALDRAIALREVIYRIFSAVAAGGAPDAVDLAALNAAAPALAHLRVAWTQQGFDWDWDGDEDALDQMLWPVVRSTVDLLTSEALERVGECADDRGCGWLYLDTSRNRSRRWCSMDSCGNRAKVRRHYERQRAE